jgi:uncharacterized protein
MNDRIPQNFRLLAALLHFIGALMPVISVISILITWVLWMTTKDKHPFIDLSGRSALNFQISIVVYTIASLCCLGAICGIMYSLPNLSDSIVLMVAYPAIFIMAILFVGAFSLPIFATILAINGKIYSYPLTIRFWSELL